MREIGSCDWHCLAVRKTGNTSPDVRVLLTGDEFERLCLVHGSESALWAPCLELIMPAHNLPHRQLGVRE